jgi:hypothetical protein
VSYQFYNQYFDHDEPVIPTPAHSVECIRGLWCICLLQEEDRALSIVADGFKSEREARVALREMDGEPIPGSDWPALVVAGLLAMGAFVGVWLSR